MQRHRIARHAGDARRDVARQARHLRRDPDLDLAVGHARGAVDRLHRRVRQVGRAIDRLDRARGARLGRRDIAGLVEDEAACRARGAFQFGFDARPVRRHGGRRRQPFDLRAARRALGMPPAARDDGDARRRARFARQVDDALDARLAAQRVDVDAADAAAEHRAHAQAREQQARRAHVDAEARAPVELGADVAARRGAADQRPGGARLAARHRSPASPLRRRRARRNARSAPTHGGPRRRGPSAPRAAASSAAPPRRAAARAPSPRPGAAPPTHRRCSTSRRSG